MNFAVPESQRDSVNQPMVAESVRLPWVTRHYFSQPQRGCSRSSADGFNPVGVGKLLDLSTQGSRFAPTLGWMTLPRWGKSNGA